MSAAASRVGEPRVIIAALVALLATAFGALAGMDPKFAIAGSLALAFVLIAIVDMAAGIAIFGLLTFLELAPFANGPVVSFAKIAGLTLAISWLAAIATDRSRNRLFFTSHPALTALIGGFLAWALLSASWAESPGVAVSTFTRYAINIALFPIVFTAISQAKHMRWLSVSIAAGAAMAAAYGLVAVPSAAGAASSITAAGELDRISGTVGDPNLLAAVLVVGIVFALAVTMDPKRQPSMRLATLGAAGLCLLAIFATVSRGGLIALGAALIAAIMFGGHRRGRIALGATIIVTIVLGFFAFFATDAELLRIEQADGGSGRTSIWKIGWRMVEAHPIRGVGGGNFNVSSIHYLLAQPGALERDEFVVDEPSVAHNTYLEVLSELGIIGLTLFLLIIGISIATAVRAAIRFDAIGETGLSLIARAGAISIVSTMAADFFLSDEYSKLLWLLLAIGPAMLAIATRMQEAEARGEQPAG